MTVRFFGALGIFAMIAAFIIILVSYAGFPNDVLVYIDDLGDPATYIPKGTLFYVLIAFIMLFNIAFFGLNNILRKRPNPLPTTQAGINLTQIFFNMFLASSVYFINILNSRENFNYSNFGYLIYVTGALLAVALVFTIISGLLLKK